MEKLYSVHPKHLETVKLVWKRKRRGRDIDLANELDLDLPIVNLFLIGKPIKGLFFVEICQALHLNWREIAGLELLETPVKSSEIQVDTSEVDTVDTSDAIGLRPRYGNAKPKLIEEVNTVDDALGELVDTLKEMLTRLTRKAGNILKADRTSIFLLDQHSNILGSIDADDGKGGSLVIDIPADKGIAGAAATSLSIINVPFDVYDDPRSEEAKRIDKITGYRTYTMLAWPVLNQQKNLVAVVQLINKLKPDINPNDDLYERIDLKGFTKKDEALLAQFTPSILRNLERCQLCFQLARKLWVNSESNSGIIDPYNQKLITELQEKEKQVRKSLKKLTKLKF
ncbi:GAF domain-containing protein [Moorena bouillonii]|uniref:GAF domain-containing protein n=1 Tax=Moorena bouillonii PNG TaxID=568701 RepID=A0A1U7N3H8_9CYAN|nr:GAF domain-containing protein [Moorena bouillonii]OLT60512.1 GAF domain-containing protein [Moorena bouillonii PNG]